MRDSLMGRRNVERVLAIAAGMRREHGLTRAIGLFLFRTLARLSGGTLLACMHKPVGLVEPCAARLLTRPEIETASTDPELDLPPEFVASTQHSQCYGVLVDGQVRCYAWASSEPVRAVPGTIVRMSPDAAYVFKAFTDPSFRRRGLLRECLKAIEQGAVLDGRDEVTALVEVHNRSSLRAFRNAGFDRCGFVFVLRRPWLVKRIGCTCATPCTWYRDRKPAPASLFRSAPHGLARRT
jgi:ribosomal protein S18 acetylase RimI-like enzyme